jgi:CheY-like chemotaxis protein
VSASTKKILIVDPSTFSRGLIRSGLDMAGYIVAEASNQQEAIQSLERQRPDVILVSLNLPNGEAPALLAATRNRPGWEQIPVLAITESIDGYQAPEWQGAGFQDCQPSFDSAAILESVAKLVSESALEDVELETVGEMR